MGNKIIMLLLIVIFTACDKHTDCKLEEIDSIYFEGFDSINKISIEDLVDKTNNFEYLNPKLESTNIKAKRLEISSPSSNLFKNGFIIRVNDSMSYKITDVKMEEVYIEKNTMWGKIYGCAIKEYKINDSLITTYGMIIIEK